MAMRSGRGSPILPQHRQAGKKELRNTLTQLVRIHSEEPDFVPQPNAKVLDDVISKLEEECYQLSNDHKKYEELISSKDIELAGLQCPVESYLLWLHYELKVDIFSHIECAAVADACAGLGQNVQVRNGPAAGCTGVLIKVHHRMSPTKGPEAFVTLRPSGRQCQYDLHDVKWVSKKGALNALRHPQDVQTLLERVEQIPPPSVTSNAPKSSLTLSTLQNVPSNAIERMSDDVVMGETADVDCTIDSAITFRPSEMSTKTHGLASELPVEMDCDEGQPQDGTPKSMSLTNIDHLASTSGPAFVYQSPSMELPNSSVPSRNIAQADTMPTIGDTTIETTSSLLEIPTDTTSESADIEMLDAPDHDPVDAFMEDNGLLEAEVSTPEVLKHETVDDSLQPVVDAPYDKCISPQETGSTNVAVHHDVSDPEAPHNTIVAVGDKPRLQKFRDPGVFEVLSTHRDGQMTVRHSRKDGYEYIFRVARPRVRLQTLEETLSKVHKEVRRKEAQRGRADRKSRRRPLGLKENHRERRTEDLECVPTYQPQFINNENGFDNVYFDPELEMSFSSTQESEKFQGSEQVQEPEQDQEPEQVQQIYMAAHPEGHSAGDVAPTQEDTSDAAHLQASGDLNTSAEQPSPAEPLHPDASLDVPPHVQNSWNSLAITLWLAFKQCQGAWKLAHPWLQWIIFSLLVPFILIVVPAVWTGLHHFLTVVIPASAKTAIKSLEYVSVYVEFRGDRKTVSNNELAITIGRSVWGERDRESILRDLEELGALKEHLAHRFPSFRRYFGDHEYKDLAKLRLISELLDGTITFPSQIPGLFCNAATILREDLLEFSTSESNDEKGFAQCILQALGMQVFFKEYADVKTRIDQYASLRDWREYFKALEDLRAKWFTFLKLGISEQMQSQICAEETMITAMKHVSHRHIAWPPTYSYRRRYFRPGSPFVS